MQVSKNTSNFVRVNNSMTIECLVVRRLCLNELCMRKYVRIAWITCTILLLFLSELSAKNKYNQKKLFDWTPIIDAIISVESEGKADAVDKSGKSCGILQITPVMVKDCNRILKLKDSKKRYTLKDRFSVTKSKEMFRLYQSFYNPSCNVEYAIRLWNGGSHHTKRGTQKYYEKVISKMK